MKNLSRRSFINTTLRGAAGLAVLPGLIPGRVFGADAPSKRINVAQIGCGRMGRGDMSSVMGHRIARIVAVCDLDSKRLDAARKMAENFYQKGGETNVAIKSYRDHHELLASPEIDAVIVSVPDYWHAPVAIAAAIAGKHVYVQKPVTYNISEAIGLRKTVQARKIILQTGSQQRSEHPFPAFRAASEAVRNGRIGKLKTIQVGIGMDSPSRKKPVPDPVPETLDYERLLGPAPEQPYMEGRMHPQNSFDARPGWITTEDFGLGMITNWGAHHMDIAQWAMGQELGGPMTLEAQAQFMKDDLWTVHTSYHVEMLYPGEVRVIMDNKYENGLRFEGSEGWVFCARGADRVTASDPNVPVANNASLRASDPKILSPLNSGATRWMPSSDHYLNWLESIQANRQPIAPIEQSSRSLEACATAWIAMKLGRKLTWDAATEMFVGDDAANAMRSRKARKPEYDFELAMQKAGIV